MAEQGVHLKKQGQIAWLTLNPPVQDNIPVLEMAAALREACRLVAEDEMVRVALLTGVSDCFYAPSLHTLRFADAVGDNTSLRAREEALEQFRIAAPIAALKKPTIAAINGAAIGQGLELALACDLRIAVQEARFAMPQIASGLLPWDGGTQRLPRIVGRARALDLLLTGREVDAHEALEMGLVHQVTLRGQLLPQCQELAERIAASAPIAARYAKEAVLKGIDLSLEAGLRLEADLNILLHSSFDRSEGLRSFLERREPRFQGR